MPKKILTGVVVSNKMNKTITVLVNNKVEHKIYKKIINSSKKYLAHSYDDFYQVGDKVSIVESKPFSKNKKWAVIK